MSASSLAAVTYRRRTATRISTLIALAVAAALFLVVDIATGPAMLSVPQVLYALAGVEGDRATEVIVWSIRLPTALMAVAVGAALGLSGTAMQTILNNPLASSYTLGVSAGAGFGAALVIVLGAAVPVAEAVAVPASAFLFSGLTCATVYLIGRSRGSTPEMLVLAGIALMFLFQALLALLQVLATPEALQQIVSWLFGNLQRTTWPAVAMVAGITGLCIPVLLRDAWRLTALRLGDERAAALGVPVAALRIRVFALISLLTAVSVAFVGTIGFIGLVAPHAARFMVGEDQRFLLPGSALLGAALLSAASVASKLVMPGAVFPIGILTSLIGVPFFLWLVLASRRAYWT